MFLPKIWLSLCLSGEDILLLYIHVVLPESYILGTSLRIGYIILEAGKFRRRINAVYRALLTLLPFMKVKVRA